MQPSRPDPYHLPSPPVPAVLHLVQSVMQGRWRATGEELYREVADLAQARAGTDLIVVASGDGVTAEWLAARTGATVTAVDADARHAESRRRRSGAATSVTYETAPLDDLPHETSVFDAAIGEPALAAASDAERAIGELVRVTRPFGHVVLLLPTWTSGVAEGDRQALAERLALRPRLLVEWKRILREAGVVDITVQDWSAGAPSGRAATPRDALPALTWRQKTHIAARAWRRRGWRAARGAVRREQQLLRELSRDRSLGIQLLSGVKWPHGRVS